jgi:methionyl-tRNA synthetase
MDDYHISDAIEEIFNVLRLSNKYIDETMPWALAKEEDKKDRLETVLYNLIESIRVCGLLLEPFMASTSKKIIEQLNTKENSLEFVLDNKYNLNQPSPLFLRINKEEFDK